MKRRKFLKILGTLPIVGLIIPKTASSIDNDIWYPPAGIKRGTVYSDTNSNKVYQYQEKPGVNVWGKTAIQGEWSMISSEHYNNNK